MSTKSTIATINEHTHLEEEMLDDTTWLVTTNAHIEVEIWPLGSRIKLHLTAPLLDKIAEIHAQRGFPHQRQD
jgi:hypothetical protein